MAMPDWDFFNAYRNYSGWELISPFIHVVKTAEGKLVYVKSHVPVDVGQIIAFGLVQAGSGKHEPEWEEGPAWEGDEEEGCFRGPVVETYSREWFGSFNLEIATEMEVRVLGEWMCGVGLHGQFFGQMLEQMRHLAQNVRDLENRLA